MQQKKLFFHGTPGQLPISWSEDGGHTWQMCPTVPEERSAHGHIAVSSDGAAWIWTPSRKPAYRTTDQGKSWQKVEGLPTNIRTIADKENPNLFYAVDVVNRHLYVSEDAAKSWIRINDDEHQYGLVLHIIGDMQEYGRVYIGTHGRGIITGQKSTSASQK